MDESRFEKTPGGAFVGQRANDILATPAWRLYGISGSVPGVLVLSRGRLTLAVEDGRGFEAPLSEVTEMVFPWYYTTTARGPSALAEWCMAAHRVSL